MPSLEDAVAAIRDRTRAQTRPTHGWDSLTDAERRVVQLVTEGLTNPQIGQRRFVSSRTVHTHVAHVFAKLHVPTRAELAAFAAHPAQPNVDQIFQRHGPHIPRRRRLGVLPPDRDPEQPSGHRPRGRESHAT